MTALAPTLNEVLQGNLPNAFGNRPIGAIEHYYYILIQSEIKQDNTIMITLFC